MIIAILGRMLLLFTTIWGNHRGTVKWSLYFFPETIPHHFWWKKIKLQTSFPRCAAFICFFPLVKKVVFCRYPPVNKHSNGISPFSIGNTSSKGPFSIAILVYRRVGTLTPKFEERIQTMLWKKNIAKVIGIGYFSNDQDEAPMLWKKVSPESNMFFFGVSCIISNFVGSVCPIWTDPM